METRCQYRGQEGDSLDKDGRCLKDATRETDARALDRTDEHLDLCDQHHQVVKAYWLEQGNR